MGKTQKYLTFSLGSEQYGVDILKVREIIGLMEITRVPRTPDFVRGVINLRGKVIPIIALRKKFDMSEVQDTDQTCIIVVEIVLESSPVLMGIIVDSVSEVLDVQPGEIEEPPRFGTAVSTDFMKGIANTKDGVTILLNIEKVLTSAEVQSLAESTAADSAPPDAGPA